MRLLKRYEEFLEISTKVDNIVLFGASKGGYHFIDNVFQYEYISFFCDNDEKKWGV